MNAYIFPGQGSQFVGMGKDLYDGSAAAKRMFEAANDILGFRISDIIFSGSEADLQQTRVTQPSVFLHSVISFFTQPLAHEPHLVAGHSLGEFSALTAAKVLNFDDALRLVYTRALAMQKACNAVPSTMAAVLKCDTKTIDDVCRSIDDIIVVANYNSPDQTVISGTCNAIDMAIAKFANIGVRRIIKLPVNGAFHSPLMQQAKNELKTAIEKTTFHEPQLPVFQNVDGQQHSSPDIMRQKLIEQLTNPVRWTEEVQNMTAFGADTFIECGPGNVLSGLVKRINKSANIYHIG